jgi:hypothetical protein
VAFEVAPGTAEKLPARHGRHTAPDEARVVLEYVPGAQSVQFALPGMPGTAEKVPAAHA